MAKPEYLEILNQGVEAWNKWRKENWGEIADLSFLKHEGEDLSHIDFRGTALYGAELGGSNLMWANLNGVNFGRAFLNDVDLSYTYLLGTNFNNAWLPRANFTGATFSDTVLNETNLSEVKGLEHAHHMGSSVIGISTIYRSQGKIPEKFLRGCGVPEDFIIYMRSLTVQPIQFYSCFISYSSADQEFAERLHADLQANGVRVWFAPHDLPIGARIRPAIDESIRVHDKLLLVLSETSVSSQWVEQEVETALAREREQEGRTVLFPIRIDDVVMDSKAGWPALLKNTRNVGDFTRWKEHDHYAKAVERLLRDLKAGA